jgi:hypothetical protein
MLFLIVCYMTEVYYDVLYNKIANLYATGMSIPRACHELKISVRKYYKICEVLKKPSATKSKHLRFVIPAQPAVEWVEYTEEDESTKSK